MILPCLFLSYILTKSHLDQRQFLNLKVIFFKALNQRIEGSLGELTADQLQANQGFVSKELLEKGYSIVIFEFVMVKFNFRYSVRNFPVFNLLRYKGIVIL